VPRRTGSPTARCSRVLLSAPFSSARSALVADILTERQLPVGSAIGNITHQTSQIAGFVTGAAVVATIGSYRTLGIDAGTFGISALILLIAVKPRPAAARTPGKRPTMRSVSADGIRIVFAAGAVARRVRVRRGTRPGHQGPGLGRGPIGPVRRPGDRDPGRRRRGTACRRADGGQHGRAARPVRGGRARDELESAAGQDPQQPAGVTSCCAAC